MLLFYPLNLNERIKSKEEFGLGLAVMLANNPLIKDYLSKGLRDDALSLVEEIIANYAATTNYRGLKVQIHTAQGKSWMRSWNPTHFGDDLQSRSSITKIMQERIPFSSSTEIGLVGFAIRGIAPIFIDNKYLGSLEVLQGVGSVSRDFESDKQIYILLLNNKLIKESPSIEKNIAINNYLLPNDKWFNKRAIDFAKLVESKKTNSDLSKASLNINEKWFYIKIPILNSNGDLIGLHLVGEPEAGVNKQISTALSSAWVFMLIIAFLIIGMEGMVAWQVQRRIICPITKFQKELSDITKNLDVTKRLKTKDRGDLGELANQTNNLLSQLENALKEVYASSNKINITAKRLAITAGFTKRSTTSPNDVNQSMAVAVEQMSASVAEITSTMEELSASSTQIADYSHVVVNVANKTLDSSKKGVKVMQGLQENMTVIHQDSTVSLEEMLQLGQQSKAISKIMDLINTLADQTKLIAFNAALEASSAGESGKRFSVVASEIRHLADRVTESTFEIEERIQEIQDSISRLVITSEKGVISIQKGIQLSYEATDELNELVSAASKTSSAATQISHSTQQQKIASSQVVVALHSITSGSSFNAQSVREISNISEEMLLVSAQLNKLVNEFCVDDIN